MCLNWNKPFSPGTWVYVPDYKIRTLFARCLLIAQISATITQVSVKWVVVTKSLRVPLLSNSEIGFVVIRHSVRTVYFLSVKRCSCNWCDCSQRREKLGSLLLALEELTMASLTLTGFYLRLVSQLRRKRNSIGAINLMTDKQTSFVISRGAVVMLCFLLRIQRNVWFRRKYFTLETLSFAKFTAVYHVYYGGRIST